jgi:hypothetical protein
MIDLDLEPLVPLKNAVELVPGGVHYHTLLNWAIRGIRGHKLETILIGRRRYTSEAAIKRLIQNLNPETHDNPPSAAERRRQVERGRRALDEQLARRGMRI